MDDSVSPKTAPTFHAQAHAQSTAEVLEQLDVSTHNGLATAEVELRQAQWGPNTLPEARKTPALVRFLRQFHNVLIYVLLVAGGITLALGHWVDSGVIFGVTLINAFIGFIQEGKAEEALNSIRNLLSPKAQVLRDGQRASVDSRALVPGDIVFLTAGDKVPADLRLLHAHNLQIDESALTGESLPVEKQLAPVSASAALADRRCMAYSGTLVTAGQATALVVATGVQTEIGRIGQLLAQVKTLTTPLTKKMARFSQWLTWIILIASSFTFAFGIYVRDYSVAEMFLVAVGLAVAAIPEGLPAIVTITLAIGVQRMAKRQAIIRHLPAVEALGSVTVICSDKTGTLTRNEMTVQRVLIAHHEFDVSGEGYSPHGGFSEAGQEIAHAGIVRLEPLARACLLCNDASIITPADALPGQKTAPEITGTPTEAALIALAMKVGLVPSFEREAWPRADVIPFDSQHKFMASLHHDHQGQGVIYIKGAPEKIITLCQTELTLEGPRPLDPEHLHQLIAKVAAEGMRVLAIACLATDASKTALTFADIEQGGFTLMALLGLSDPPRSEAIDAIARCRSAGIRIKMITGDHLGTALAIGRKLALDDRIEAMQGKDIDLLDDQGLKAAVKDTVVFARTTPEHKLRLVTALQANGEVVTMTGDGVNDAPALRRADVGVAMGCKGTEAAKEAAKMVLADDNFVSISAAVEEGRTVYDNIRKSILFVLPTNFAEAGVILIAILAGLALPVTPVQILWVNMITAVTLALALAFEKGEPHLMTRPPRPPAAPLMNRRLIGQTLSVAGLLAIGVLGFFLWDLQRNDNLDHARTMAVNALVVGEMFYLFNVRRSHGRILSREGLLGNRVALLAVAILLPIQIAFTHWGQAQALFGTTDISLASWGKIFVFGLVLAILIEIGKGLARRSARALVQPA